MLRKLINTFLVVVWFPKTFRLNGITLRLANLSRTLRYYIISGRYENEEQRLCSKYLTPQDSVIEVGSSIGFISLYCKKHLHVKNILSVEPNPAAFEELKYNFSINNEVPLLLEACLTASDGECVIYHNDDLWETTLLKAKQSTNHKQVKVRGISLSTLCKEASFIPTTVILDIEGAEEQIDFTQLPESVKKIIIEIHPGLTGYPNSFFVLNRLMNLGFGVVARISNCYALIRA